MKAAPIPIGTADEKLAKGARACLYASAAQVTQADGADAAQVELLAKTAQAKGWVIAATFTDWGISGLAEKPGLEAMIEAALRGEFGVVVVLDISRFGRDGVDVFDRLLRLHKAGVVIWLADNGAVEPSPNSCLKTRAGMRVAPEGGPARTLGGEVATRGGPADAANCLSLAARLKVDFETAGPPLGQAVNDAMIYLRSGADTGAPPISLKAQLEACTAVCQDKGWDISRVVIDEEIRRPGDPNGINAVVGSRADVVVVYDLAFLSPSTNLQLWLFAVLRDRDVEVAVAAGFEPGPSTRQYSREEANCRLLEYTLNQWRGDFSQQPGQVDPARIERFGRLRLEASDENAFPDEKPIIDDLLQNPTVMGMIDDIDACKGDDVDFVELEARLQSADQLIWLLTDEPITAARLSAEISALDGCE